METTLNNKFVKELVVALEMSENRSILTRILTWTAKSLNEILVNAPVNSRNKKIFLSMVDYMVFQLSE